MVDDRALKLGERGEALVEVPLGEPGGQTHPADAESTSALGSGDLVGGLNHAVAPVETPVIRADPLEGHRHLVLHVAHPS